ncbi:MAG TPA: M1 family aminopeptidase [Candidatus Dormibacteraeota bacterium]|nr:M1 family aminopeptidase [Candidatus Dormibacteraeota bacterium]
MVARYLLTLVTTLALGVPAGTTWAPPTPSGATTTRVTQSYAITATLDVAAGWLDAIQELTLTNRAAHPIGHINLSVIPRALGYLTLDQEITADGNPVRTTWTTGTNLRVPLGGSLAPNETVLIRIPFRLTVGVSGGAFTARLSRHNGVLSFGEWFPILSRVHDSYGVGDPQVSYNAERIRLDLTTTTPLARDAVACAGLVAAPETTGTAWTCEVENVRDFSFVVNPDFRLTTRTIGPTTMRVYSQTVPGSVIADKAQVALIGLNQAYGQYPWPDLVLAEVGASDGFSMEYPRSIHMTRGKVTDTYVIYHEVAHQWFYAQLGNDQMNEPWLDEGFADFSARWLMGIGENQCSTRDVDSPVFAWDAEPIAGGDWQSCDGYFHAIFYKSTEFLNAVRARMGDEDFFAALRAFVDENRYGVITTRQLLDHLEAWNAADLLPLFRTYLRGYDQGPAPAPPPRLGGICGWIDCGP